MKPSPRALLVLPFLAACASSAPTGPIDSSVPPDAHEDVGFDAGTVYVLDTGVDVGFDAGPICGNQVREFGEACDDGNRVDNDACRNDCTRPPLCGDGTMEAPEGCDDGNNASGDGCAGDCQVESCGNGRLDVGEVCDGTPGCNVTCDSVTTCGNGTLDAGEQCDDGARVRWDGCSDACEVERAVILNQLELVSPGPCDLDGDGYGDSALGVALGLAWTQLKTLVNQVLTAAPFNVLILQGTEDPTFASVDPDVRVAWVRGTDANGTQPNFDGNGTVRVQASSLVNGDPALSLLGSLAGNVLTAGPEDVSVPFYAGLDLVVKRARVIATPLTVMGTAPATTIGIDPLAGHLCGSVAVAPFSTLPSVLNYFSLPGIPTTSCDPTVATDAQISLADLIVGGVQLDDFVDIVYPTQPDVDMDGDGLERYVVIDGTACQSIIASCIDGDGTAIPGRNCVNDPRMADTISAAFDFTAVRTRLVP